MQILVETTPDCRNLGDVAMFDVCRRRLRELWPDARILAFTSAPDRLQALFPDVEPFFIDSRDIWFRSLRIPALVDAALRRWRPLAVAGLIARQLRSDPDAAMLLGDFVNTLRGTDLFVIGGMGSLTSAFGDAPSVMAEMISAAASFGVPAVALSQGLGPIDPSSRLWGVARRNLRLLRFIALRESRFGPRLLQDLGVRPDRFAVTGDDAIEIALSSAAAGRDCGSCALGVCFRLAKYGGMTPDHYRQIAQSIEDAAEALGAAIVPVPVSDIPEASDQATLDMMFGSAPPYRPAPVPRTPRMLCQRIGSCRLVVTGVYHAAVFALGQGIPAVCVYNSPYYEQKFLGLANQFGPEFCRVLPVSNPDCAANLRSAIEECWHSAAQYRSRLLEAARRQVDLSAAAYSGLPAFARPERRAGGNDRSAVRDAWYRHRCEVLQAQLVGALTYMTRVEEARDWHRLRADRAEAELKRAR